MQLSAQMIAIIKLAENEILESNALLAWYKAGLAIATGYYMCCLWHSLWLQLL